MNILDTRRTPDVFCSEPTERCAVEFKSAWGPATQGAPYCDQREHFVGTAEGKYRHVGPCPVRLAAEVAARLAEERRDLAPLIARANRGGGSGFDGYDVTRAEGGAEALAAMRTLAAGGAAGVVLLGPSGLGKTRLQLAAHLALVAAGHDSVFARACDLRILLARRRNFDAEIAQRADQTHQRLARAAYVHLDDLGDETPPPSQAMAGQIKSLVDESIGVWSVSVALTVDEAKGHPDIGWPLLSRFVDGGGTLVKLKGANFRAATARIVGAK